FDPTVGPLVDLWQIGNEGAKAPALSEINKAVSLVEYEHIVLDEEKQTIYAAKEGMGLDLGAIAKGYAADEIASYLEAHDFHSAIIDLGGNILALGLKPDGQAW